MKSPSPHISRRRALLGMSTATLAGSGALSALRILWPVGSSRAASAAPAPVRVVVELFTSQGCSACPPADALFGKLCEMPGVLGISYNVDIWDYLGWRDTLARPEFTRRHRKYARAWGQESIYTPQLVINGRRCAQREAPMRVRALLDKASAEGDKGLSVPVRLRRRKNALLVEVGARAEAPPTDKATLWLVTMKRLHRQRIRRGENAGREIVYHHVARSIAPAGMWHGQPLRLELPHEHVMTGEADLCAVLLQLRGHGPIIGAAVL